MKQKQIWERRESLKLMGQQGVALLLNLSLKVALMCSWSLQAGTGLFQMEEKCTVLETVISTKTAYIEACDDWRYSCLAKSFHEKSVPAGVLAITTRRIDPEVSNCMPSAKACLCFFRIHTHEKHYMSVKFMAAVIYILFV
ncbi:uncharacterized protein LOC131078211 [Cryptomeria japonica]|uniref:uncharacterized protein LOC131078211 n=1 Tax=Cryptomeria japonica TaxID=3369 RepID=UPI0027DA492E|nr:uncharacterized protein LOC131078211 [Cryptomeria japonica]